MLNLHSASGRETALHMLVITIIIVIIILMLMKNVSNHALIIEIINMPLEGISPM